MNRKGRFVHRQAAALSPAACLAGLAMIASASVAWSQVVPAHPTRSTTRSVSGGNSASVGVEQPPDPPRKVREVTYVVLSPQRQFLSNDGKSLLGKLVAFEQTVTEKVEEKGQDPTKEPSPENAPPPPAKPTVVKDGKVRLLINAKIFEVPLSRLSSADQTYIENLRQRIEGKAAGPAPQENPPPAPAPDPAPPR